MRIRIAYYVLVTAFFQCEELAANVRVFDSAAHYWPLNRQSGIVDIRTNDTGTKHGQIDNIFFKGPKRGYLHASGKAWIDLGNFTGSCLSEPARCNHVLTVFLWLKYSRNKNKRYLVGTSGHLSRESGFTIYKESDKIANNSIVLRVNDGRQEWTGHLTLKPEVWSHVAFTWEYSSGLAVFQNCRQMALVTKNKYQPSPRRNRSNVLEQHLTLAGAQNVYPNVGVKASFEDLTVLYRKLDSSEMNWICFHKLDAPELNSTCQGSRRWLAINWNPPAMTYDILIGYSVWYRGESSDEWVKVPVEKEATFLNLTNLDPGTRYNFQVQNAFRFGFGQTSSMIECQTNAEVLNPPLNVTIEMKSSIGILLKWVAPPGSAGDVLGYKITYTAEDSDRKLDVVKVGPVTSFLLTELHRNTKYIIKVASYGDKRFLDSAPALRTVQTENDDKTSVKETLSEVKGFDAFHVTWKKPRGKYKVFFYRAFIKWESPGETENTLEVYDGNATFCEYSVKENALTHRFYVMAYVVREIPLVRIAGERFSDLAFLFRRGERTLSQVVYDTCQALFTAMKGEYLKVPATAEDWHKVAEEFDSKWNYPCCIGALDGKHIAIQQPPNSGSEFFNYKHFFSVLLLALVDANYKFLYVDVGAPGRAGDAGVFAESSLKKGLEGNTLNLPPAKTIEGIPSPLNYHIVGDDAFPLSKNIMKPYPQRNLDKAKRIFNYRLSRARRVVENAFGILANRFRVFLTTIRICNDKVVTLILAACCLHNFMVETNKHTYLSAQDVENTDQHSIATGTWRNDPPLTGLSTSSDRNPAQIAKQQRKELTDYFMSNFGSVPWQDNMITC